MKRWNATELSQSPWFQELQVSIQEAVARRTNAMPDRRPALTAESAQLETQVQGWSQSLANPDLQRAVRRRIEADCADAEERLECIQVELAKLDTLDANSTVTVSPELVADRLNRLADILKSEDPTRTNLELALHIDRIVAHDDGHIEVRTCKLGALTGVAAGVAELTTSSSLKTPNVDTPRAKQRRRALLAVNGAIENVDSLDDTAHFAANIDRFAGLGPEWFWVDEFTQPEKTCWAKENALAVAAKRAEGLTHAKLATFFGVVTATIRKALAFAAKLDKSVAELPRKIPRARWPELHADEVARLRGNGRNLKELCAIFGKSEPWIRKALKLAAQRSTTSCSDESAC